MRAERALATEVSKEGYVVEIMESREVWSVMREEFSFPFTSGWKDLLAFMRLVKEGLGVVGVVGVVGKNGEVGEMGVAGVSISWSLVSVVLVEDEEVEALLLLREVG